MQKLKATMLGATLLAAILSLTLAPAVQAQSMTTTEEKFQDIFITAGYATAFGAALGAASLSFFENPADHLQYVAIGASLGFIGGSILGSWVVFSPTAFSAHTAPSGTLLGTGRLPERSIAVRPNYDPETRRLTSLATAFNLVYF